MIFKKSAINHKGLRIERSENCSGVLFSEYRIPILREQDYYVKNRQLDGDAPKQFIKAYFHGEDICTKKKDLNSWCSYIAKTAEKWYPVESVIEFMINRIGEELGLKMNRIRLVRANSQIRFLSKYFLGKDERLVHGAEICGEYLEDMRLAEEIAKHKPTARELFTFEFIKDAIQTVYPRYYKSLLNELVRMIAFDALVGNNDRHFYNWGIIDSIKKSKKVPTFAPLYDSARGLLWNISDDNVSNWLKIHKQGGKKIVNYIKEASPRISIEGNSKVNHFELIEFLRVYNKQYHEIISSLASEENENSVLRMLNREFYVLFAPERSETITLILKSRFQKIRR